MFINNALTPITRSVSSGYVQSPNDDAAHTTGQAIVEIKAGDILRMRNASGNTVLLNPNIGESVFPISAASISIILLKSLAQTKRTLL